MEPEKKQKKTNIMFLHLKPLIPALILFLGYELIIYKFQIVFWVLGALLVSVILGTRQLIGSWRRSMVPILFFTGSALLLFFVSGGWLIQAYIGVSVSAYYMILLSIYRLAERDEDETAQKIKYMMVLATFFLWCAALFAYYLNRNISLGVILGVVYGVTFLLTRQLLRVVVLGKKLNNWFYALVMAYCMLILAWIVHFLPFGYLTLASLLLISYFVFINYLINALKDRLTKMTLVWDMTLFGVVTALVLVTARWSLVDL